MQDIDNREDVESFCCTQLVTGDAHDDLGSDHDDGRDRQNHSCLNISRTLCRKEDRNLLGECGNHCETHE